MLPFQDRFATKAQQREIESEVEGRSRRGTWQPGPVEFYFDAGKSAKDQKRPELQRLIRDVAADRIDVVICFKLDRITRSLRDFIELWQLFEDHNVDVISLREQFDSSTPAEKAMLRLIMVFAELEREMTGERTFAIMLDRVARGFWNGGHILGYRSDPNEKGRLIIEESSAAIVRMIFDLFQELGSAGAALRKLTELGIGYPKYKTRSGKSRGGSPFTKQQLIGILRNPIYIGRIRWGQAFRDDCHPPIISKEQFALVQHHLGETIKRRTNFRKMVGRNYVLTGLLRCQCGAHMVGAAAHGRNRPYRYYVCNRQIHEGSRKSCQAPRIPADEIEQAVYERVREIGSNDHARNLIVEKTVEGIDESTRRLQAQRAAAQNRLGQVRAEMGRIIDALKQLGGLAAQKVEGELTRLVEEENHLEQSIKDLAAGQAPLDETTEQARQFLKTWKGVGDLVDQLEPEQRNQILPHYVEVIELRSIDPVGKVGIYALQLLPEIRRFQNPDDSTPCSLDDPRAPRPTVPTLIRPETIGAAPPPGCDPDVLTEDGVVRITVQKAPRVGLS